MRRFTPFFMAMVFTALVAFGQEPQARSPVHFNFETGGLQGWKVVSGKFGPLPAWNDMDRHGGSFNKEGKYFIGTCELGDGPYSDSMTGRIRSPIFKITAGKTTLLVGGGNHPDKTYVALLRASDGKELFRETGRNAERMDLRTWDVSPYRGALCYIEVVDEATGPWGHINVDDIREITPEEEARIARAEADRRKAMDEALAAWKKSLFDRGATKVYTGEELTKIAIPMGGIGTGSVALCGNGSLREWQIFNNVDKSAVLPHSFFAVWARQEGGAATARLLQSEAIGTMPGVEATEFSGEYPIAWVRYKDKALPVEVRLESYSPMIPLNPKDSAIPGVVFTFVVRNPGAEKVHVSLAGSLENGVGYEGHGKVEGVQSRDFCGNVNTMERRGKVTAVVMRPSAGHLGRFERPLRVFAPQPIAASALKLCENLRLDVPDWRRRPELRLPAPKAIARDLSLIWLGDLPANLSVESSAVDSLCEGVRNGGRLLLTGQERTLFTILAHKAATETIEGPEFLPLTCDGVERSTKGMDLACDKASPIFRNVGTETIHLGGRLVPKNMQLKENAKVLLRSPAGEPLIVEGPFGKGRVMLCLAPLEYGLTGADQKTLLANLVALAAGTSYAPPTGVPDSSPTFGSMTLATLAEDPSALAQWDDPERFWKEFAATGALTSAGEKGPSRPGRTWNGALAALMTLAPGEEKAVTFLLTWHFPNHYKCEPSGYNVNLGNMYCSWFKDALDAATYLGDHFDRLSAQTRLYHDTLYDTTLPRWVMDLVSSQSSIIRTQTLMWLAGDVVAGYEGCGGAEGCCPMNCTHVYNYEQSLAHLFPSLERNMRTIDLKVQMDPQSGMVRHRTNLPLAAPRTSGEAIDGQFGTVLKAYRDHLRSPDRSFLDSVWLELQTAMEYVLTTHDGDGDGVLDERQFNTYDCAVYGPNTFIGTLYLAALRAMEEMARMEGRGDLAGRYRERFEKGRARLVKELWNGEYFIQKYDAKLHPDCEYGTGCFSDQLLGQWWADVDNLGYVLPEEKVRSALRSIFRYNWVTDFTNFRHSQRVFADGTDKGLLICSWPKGGDRSIRSTIATRCGRASSIRSLRA
jgi:uncharacterized protein (DUF608 family)